MAAPSIQSVVVTIFIILCSSISSRTISLARDTLSASQSLRGTETLISADENFELGFFSPEGSEKQYLGIWFKKPHPVTVVWVANRDISLPKNSKGAFELTNTGLLVVINDDKTIVWSSNSSRTVQNPVAQLLNSGNLVVRDANDNEPENFLWQSFDCSSNTLLPGYKLGVVKATGLDRFLTSWKSPEDPSTGNYTVRVLPYGYPQIVLLQGSVIKRRLGPWNGLKFSGRADPRPNSLFTYGFVLNEEEISYSVELVNKSAFMRYVVGSQGVNTQYLWLDPVKGWSPYIITPINGCDTYALCGAYGSCNVDYPLCECMGGFVPKVQHEWDTMDWSSGCVRRSPLNCTNDVFLKYPGMKIPDTKYSWFNATMNLRECENLCKKNCSCTAYANSDIRDGGSGCLLWFQDLLDIVKYKKQLELDIYIRMAASEAVKKNKKLLPITVCSVFIGLVLGLGLIIYLMLKNKSNAQDRDFATKMKRKDLDLQLFDFAVIATATNNFSTENKLGEGGFGPVYKGILKGNQEIAVKRLSNDSNQGLDEFRNEVICIAKLRHRNLVKLVGCSIQHEKMLVYEYMPNKSLDFFIFDQMQRKLLNWQKRFHIINGIARGLLYLHQDSILRIVHRDLKASNVLLDHEMNPKISDFGLARSFGGNETEANTNRVVGTYGYMPPEYAIDGIFSIKSDVFSYGVLLLEILTGKKNRGFYHPDHYHNLLGHAWKMFKEGRSTELIDELLENSINLSEVSRSIHVSLLCVQGNPEDRPNMPNVVLMLGGDSSLPEPKKPGFFTERKVVESESLSSTQSESCSNNEITLTILSAR